MVRGMALHDQQEAPAVFKRRMVGGSALSAIGDTPVVRLCKVVPPDSADVLVKLEYLNPTGSYKDRMALALIEEAEKRGDLRPGMTVVEYTSGSTGSSLAFVCAIKGYPIQLVSSDAFAQEKLRAMRVFGADLMLVPSDNGKITRALIESMIRQTRQLAEREDFYWTDQFNNPDAITGYQHLGQELVDQVGGAIHAFCGGVGTAGMLVGVSRAVRRACPAACIVALEPASSAVISGRPGGSHHVEGVGVGFMPPLLMQEDYDAVRAIDEAEARAMARRLAKEEGIFAGTSTGLNVVGALQLAVELGCGHTVVTIAVDSGLKYLGGDLFQDIPNPVGPSTTSTVERP